MRPCRAPRRSIARPIIVAQKGEPRRAVLWAKKAKAEDANFPGVDALLAELGEAPEQRQTRRLGSKRRVAR